MRTQTFNCERVIWRRTLASKKPVHKVIHSPVSGCFAFLPSEKYQHNKPNNKTHILYYEQDRETRASFFLLTHKNY